MSKSRKILVTGASSGIGLATAKYLLERDYTIVCTSRSAEIIREKLSAQPSRLVVSGFDLSEIEKMEDWVRSLIGTTGPLNGFVHCAGIQRPFSINMAKPKDIEEMFRVNTMASIELIRNFCKPGSYVKDESSFVLVSSQAAHEGSLGNAVYAATKGALEGFLAPGAAELARKGIRLNAIVPGFVQTPMTDNFLKHLSDEQKLNFMAKFPLGLGEPSSIAAMAEFLVSDASNWITGQKFVVDGGRSISPV